MKETGIFTRGRQYVRTPEDVRFWRYVQKSDGCWLWVGSANPLGYGNFKRRIGDALHTVKAHRFAFYLASGEWPDDGVLHRCDNPRCVNPAHLFLGDQAANTRDMAEKGRGNNGNKGRARCIHGHRFTPENTHIRMHGGRECRACMRDRMRVRRAAKHAS